MKFFFSCVFLTVFLFGSSKAQGNVTETAAADPISAKSTKSAAEICNLEREVGPCHEDIPRWYFNSMTNKCGLFFYGGCGGNDNNFENPVECTLTCKEFIDMAAGNAEN